MNIDQYWNKYFSHREKPSNYLKMLILLKDETKVPESINKSLIPNHIYNLSFTLLSKLILNKEKDICGRFQRIWRSFDNADVNRTIKLIERIREPVTNIQDRYIHHDVDLEYIRKIRRCTGVRLNPRYTLAFNVRKRDKWNTRYKKIGIISDYFNELIGDKSFEQHKNVLNYLVEEISTELSKGEEFHPELNELLPVLYMLSTYSLGSWMKNHKEINRLIEISKMPTRFLIKPFDPVELQMRML